MVSFTHSILSIPYQCLARPSCQTLTPDNIPNRSIIMTSKTTIDQPTQNDATRPIRILTTLPIIFTIAFAIPYSVDNESVLPALGVLPMAFSACTGVYQVTGSKKRSRALTLTLDIFCACFLFSLFVPSLVVMAGGRWYRYSEEVVIGTLGAATMMLNL